VFDRLDFPAEELKTLDFWKETKAFEKQLKLTEDCEPYTFYDGPPFATGKPHYGSLLAGTVKDICTRYAAQNGKYVKRRFGWDCHGLPVEHKIDKKLGLNSLEDHLDYGIKNYNDKCREKVMKYANMWERVVNRFGRWIDFKNDYKTMDLNFMESVWWVFKQIYEKGLVYRGARIMPVSTACGTALSNFEVNLNYKDVDDPSLIITFPLIERPEVKLIAWTTTPWTLPSNLALTVNPDFEYMLFEEPKTKAKYICGKPNLGEVKQMMRIGKDVEVKALETYKGKDMVGWEYEPLFNYFISYKETGCFKVIAADFVKEETGTGIVHTAPGFGEEDFKACCNAGIIKPDNPPCPVNDNGFFTDPITEYKGMYIKEADKLIKKKLKDEGRLLVSSTIKHSYPLCWRSDTPLIYKTVYAWFIKVTSMKEDLLKNNMKSRWVPQNIQEKRFHNWLQEARDWCFSRSRYWGNPIPLWVSEGYEEVVAVGSIKELMELAGLKEPLKDIHREFIDDITIPSKKGKGVLRRVPEVFDCWFESGAMPFAQIHYPFEVSEEKFVKLFPADFIAEGLDQTRGWFYTLLVLSTAIKNSNPYKNLIVHGIVLGEDGRKLSKRHKNYTDPEKLANKTGADAIRLYMINSPLVKADFLRFTDAGVERTVREVLLPWSNAYRFLIQNVTRWEMMTDKSFVFDETVKEKVKEANANIMDKWIIAASQNLIKFIRNEMENYRLYTVVPGLLKFLEQLTNGYVRFNRSRIKGDTNPDDWNVVLNILFDVMIDITILMCCYTPFTSEMLYQNLRRGINSKSKYYAESVHHLRVPQFNPSLLNEDIEHLVSQMQNVILLGRTIRDKNKLPVKQPLSLLTVISKDAKTLENLKKLESYVMEELNVFAVDYKSNEADYVNYKISPNFQAISERLGKPAVKVLKSVIEKLEEPQIQEYAKNGALKVKGEDGNEYELFEGEIIVDPKFLDKYLKDPKCGCASNVYGCAMMNIEITEDLNKVRVARELSNSIQMARKEANVNVEDVIEVYYTTEGEEVKKTLDEHMGVVTRIIKAPFVELKYMPSVVKVIYKDQYNTSLSGKEQRVTYFICQSHLVFNVEAVKQKFTKVKAVSLNNALRKFLETPYAEAKNQLEKESVRLEVDKEELELEKGKEVFGSIEEYLKSKQ
jgi:isoleucyl-tRNA synthetase